jgi:hypothetical protein
MPEFCSCGAQLPPDARFCHRCGKPQQEIAAAEPDSPPAIEAPTSAHAGPLPLNFHNPVAVRVGLSMASLAVLLSWLPILKYGLVIWFFTAGFLAAYFYHRRTGHFLTVRSGARMGWITGVLTFVIITVLFTISVIAIASSRGGLGAVYSEQLRNMPIQDPNLEQTLQLFQTPAGIAILLLFSLIFLFVMTTVLCTAGGALGAKIAGKD